MAELQTTNNKLDKSPDPSMQKTLQEDAKGTHKEKSKTAQPPQELVMHTLVRELQTEVAEMKCMVLASMSTGRPQNYRQATSIRRRACRDCQDKGEEVNCSHCFKCGQLGHISRGCRAPRQAQGNFGGLLQGDQQ
ncbi:hypothetical protein CesoFtcFv8_007947 [Champsocephalus esox]|uniref:CCHC-type domain-containing protein n=1 Tax=Champsocephalus esox TaxID=159716 RepID=A0AAN8CFC9_9TELE|nr:hypothetical protein CesoFtcFv8_007947 [Champsocephalus esox]